MSQILVTKSSMPSFDEYVEEIADLWETHWLTNMGPKHEKLREALCEYLKISNIELLTNGHMALELSIQAFGLTGEIITTPYTFASTTHAIVRNGCKPVFCDIDPGTFTIDANKIESLITDKTSAILPVHCYGNVCDVEAIEKIAKEYNLKVLYDAAHSFGEVYKSKGIASFGDASALSFHATKVFNTIEGGAVAFCDEEFGRELYRLKNFGIQNEFEVDGVGSNAKMNEFCAAMGLCNLRHVDDEIAKREKVVDRYRQHLQNVPGIQLNPIQEHLKSNYSYFPVVFHDSFGRSREDVYNALIDAGITARRYFYPITNTFDCYKGMFDPAKTPHAVEISKRVLTLPLYADLEIDVIDRICELILS